MFIPGETIIHAFVIPFSINEIAKVIISYKQNEAIILEKEITSGFVSLDLRITKVTYEFSQQESLIFDDDVPYSVQINVLTTGGTRHTSLECKSTSGIQYLRDVITNG